MWNPRSRPSSTASRSSSPNAGCFAASAGLHLVVLATLIVAGLQVRKLPRPSEGPVVELQLVETKGPKAPVPGQTTQAAAPANPATPPPSEQKPAPQPPEPVPKPQDAPKAALSPAPSSPAPPSPSVTPDAPPPAPPAAPPRPPEMNLGGGDSMTNAVAEGPGLVQAKIDSRYHNRQPVYPRAAAARGEQGAVILLIHVGPGGDVTGVDIAQSSGFPALDRAAQKAVETWHYLPALRDGAPVSSNMALRVVFQLH